LNSFALIAAENSVNIGLSFAGSEIPWGEEDILNNPQLLEIEAQYGPEAYEAFKKSLVFLGSRNDSFGPFSPSPV